MYWLYYESVISKPKNIMFESEKKDVFRNLIYTLYIFCKWKKYFTKHELLKWLIYTWKIDNLYFYLIEPIFKIIINLDYNSSECTI